MYSISLSSRPPTCYGKVVGVKVTTRPVPRVSKVNKNRDRIIAQGFLDFLFGNKSGGSNARADEIVEELQSIFKKMKNTGINGNVSQAFQDQILEQVQELQQFCPDNPTRRKEFARVWQVVYRSKPLPFLQGATSLVIAKPTAYEVFDKQDMRWAGYITFKFAGLVQSYASLRGNYKLSGKSIYEVTDSELSIKTLGKPKVTARDGFSEREVLYINDSILVYYRSDSDIITIAVPCLEDLGPFIFEDEDTGTTIVQRPRASEAARKDSIAAAKAALALEAKKADKKEKVAPTRGTVWGRKPQKTQPEPEEDDEEEEEEKKEEQVPEQRKARELVSNLKDSSMSAMQEVKQISDELKQAQQEAAAAENKATSAQSAAEKAQAELEAVRQQLEEIAARQASAQQKISESRKATSELSQKLAVKK